jgi:Ethylbenzene dehydrogenase/Prokaryotic cytochrome b561
MRPRKTDYGTIILHWLLVGATGVALLSGLRIATEAPDRAWLNWIDVVLPRANVWVPHMQAAVVLVAVSVAYAIYMVRSSLSRRIALDKVRLRGLWGRKQARLSSSSVLLTWAFFLTMLALIVSGGCLYFGAFAGYAMAKVHWIATWGVLAFPGLHVLVHFRIGGAAQLLRVLRPERLPPPPPRLDAVELLTLLAEKSDQPAPGPQDHPMLPQNHATPSLQPDDPLHPPAARQAARRAAKPKNFTLQSNPFAVAAAVAVASASLLVALDWLSIDRLEIHRIATADAPVLDGDTSDPVWRNIQPFSVMTSQGDNFDGKGVSRIEIRAVHDGTWAYFLFTWEDPTRSLKQLPLIKKANGWHLLHDGYERGDERAYNEDKFAVLLTTMDIDLAGDRTFHASPHPLANAPETMTGRGLHFTTVEGLYADVWQWKATSGGPAGWMDDDHFGPPIQPTPMQVRNVVPYRGGFAPDPGAANYSENFAMMPDAAVGNDGNQVVTPRRLPKDLAAISAAMGQIELDPDIGESDGARWFMTEVESQAYTVELDKAIPVGTVLPGVIMSGDFSGDRADVRCAARWASGHWALEAARLLDTKSPYDVPLKSGVFMRVAAFDHSQIGHTRHVRPIRLEVE